MASRRQRSPPAYPYESPLHEGLELRSGHRKRLVGAVLQADVGSRWQARRGAIHAVRAFPGLIAELNGERIGLLLYQPDDVLGELELAALATPVPNGDGPPRHPVAR